jgi:hypothetical protein
MRLRASGSDRATDCPEKKRDGNTPTGPGQAPFKEAGTQRAQRKAEEKEKRRVCGVGA